MGRESLARSGKLFTGNPPYGFDYHKATKQICHNDAEKPRVIGMFNWVADGKSIGSLVTDFNRLGIPTRYGKCWTRQQVAKILRNPIYAGRACWGKRERRNGIIVRKKSLGEGIMIPVIPHRLRGNIPEGTAAPVQEQGHFAQKYPAFASPAEPAMVSCLREDFRRSHPHDETRYATQDPGAILRMPGHTNRVPGLIPAADPPRYMRPPWKGWSGKKWPDPSLILIPCFRSSRQETMTPKKEPE